MDTRKLTGVALAAMAVGSLLNTAQAEIICRDVEVTRGSPPKDHHRLLGTAAGAALGGLVGNQFGGGDVNTAATVAGVIGGGYAGNKIQENIQEGNQYTTIERQCEEVP